MEHDILHIALRRAVERADNNQSRFASDIGTSQQLVSYWLKKHRPLPAEYVLSAEAAGYGSRHDLRPDLYPVDGSTHETVDTAPPNSPSSGKSDEFASQERAA